MVLTRSQAAKEKAGCPQQELKQLSLDQKGEQTRRESVSGEVPVLTPKSLNTTAVVESTAKLLSEVRPPTSHPIATTDGESPESSPTPPQAPPSVREHNPTFTIPAVSLPLTSGAGAVCPPQGQAQRQSPRPVTFPEGKQLKVLPEKPAQSSKLPDGPEPTVIEIDYPATDSLLPIEGDATVALNEALINAASSDWSVACSALLMLRRLTVHHAAATTPELPVAVPLVVKAVRNLRSALSKTAIMTARDMLMHNPVPMLPLLDLGGPAQPVNSLLAQLLLNAASNDKKFVIEEAQAALLAFAETVSPKDCLPLIVPYTEHKNFKVRGKAAAVAAACVGNMAPMEAANFGLEPLLKLAARLISDNTPDAREAAKSISLAIKAAIEDSQVAAQLDLTVPIPQPPSEDEEAQEPPTLFEYYCQSILGVAKANPILRAAETR